MTFKESVRQHAQGRHLCRVLFLVLLLTVFPLLQPARSLENPTIARCTPRRLRRGLQSNRIASRALGHVLEVHAVNASDRCRRGDDCRPRRQTFGVFVLRYRNN
jgi:hypothetical protein